MKILQVIDSLHTGGAEKLVADIVPRMVALGYQVDILLLIKSNTFQEQKLIDSGVKIYFLKECGSLYNPLLIFKIIPYLKEYNLVHIHLFPASYWCVVAKFLSFSNIKFVFTEHSTSNRRRNSSFFRFVDKCIYRSFSHIICISDETKTFLVKHINRTDNVSVVCNGVDIGLFKNASPYVKENLVSGIYPDSFLIIQVSSFRNAKDQDTVIKSLSFLDEKIHVLFVGDGSRKDICRQLALTLGVYDRVHFLGIRNDIPSLLKSSDIVVLSSHYEGFGLAALEGMAAGKPTVASGVEGLSGIVGDAGVLFERGDSEQLARIIMKLMTDKEYYDLTAGRCLNRAVSYDISEVVGGYIKVYESVISESK